MIGSQDLMVGLVIVLVLFGAKKLPELAGSIGKSMKEFKKGVSDATEEEPVKAAGTPAAPASATTGAGNSGLPAGRPPMSASTSATRPGPM